MVASGGGENGWQRGVWVAKGGMHGIEGMCGKGGHAWQKGACMVKGGTCMAKGAMHGKEGCAWQRGACMGYDKIWRAGRTHPTGMHSCLAIRLYA